MSPPLDETPPGGAREYTTLVADVARDTDAIVAAWRQRLTGEDIPECKLEWFYRRNPEGMPDVLFLCHGPGKTVVGVASLARRRMRLGTEQLVVGEGIDFVVHPEHRKLLPAVLLLKDINRRARDSIEIRYAVPNARSLAIFRWIGYRCVGQMVRYVCILRSSAYLPRYLPDKIGVAAGAAIDALRQRARLLGARLANDGYRTEWLDRPDPRFDDLSGRVATPDVLMGIRNREFLHWRFVDCRPGSHTFFTVSSATDGRLVAYAVCDKQGPVLQVRDFLVDPNAAGAWTVLWRTLSREGFRDGYASLSLAFLGDARIRQGLKAMGFFARESHPVYAAASDRRKSLLEERHWYFTDADLDGL